MSVRILIILGIFISSIILGNADGVVTGRVDLPKKKITKRTKSRYFLKKATQAVPLNKPRAVVYLTSPEAKSRLVASKKELAQKDLKFVPNLLPIPLGSTVSFPNHDDEYHNVISYSLIKEFDLGRYLKGSNPPTVVFDKPGVVEINCEIHEHMRSHVLILETPYFAVTNHEGVFTLKEVPPGNYFLHAWIDDRTQYKKPVEVSEGATLEVVMSSE